MEATTMSRLWANNPEFFDEWLEGEALKGRFGTEKQRQAEEGIFNEDYKEWSRLDTDGKLSSETTADFYSRFEK
jgi:hypothetical protein